MTLIAPLIEAFLDETLARQRGVSRHTRDSYALSFQLLFMFAAKRLKVSPSALTLEQFDAGLISAFLEYLEDKRKKRAGDAQCPAGGHQVLLPLPRIQAAGSAGACPPRPGDSVQKNGSASRPLSSTRGVASGARRPGSRHARWRPRPGHAASGGLCGAARVRADGVEARGHRPVVDEHSCSWQGTAGTDAIARG